MKILSPIKIGPLTLRNRVVMPAMHLGYCPDGEVTDQLIDFYQERAAGGVGLIVVGGCPIDDVSIMWQAPCINDDRFIDGLGRLARAVHDQGAMLAAQLYQPGRYAFSGLLDGRQPIAPSPIRSKLTGEIPQEMTKEDITRVIGSFAAAAGRAKAAGLDAVEILGSAGYLICQFLSPLTNQRQDEYGGSMENRMRFGLETAQAVREAAGPDMAVIVRIAGNDFMPGSHTNAEAVQFAAALEKTGVDAFNVTGGWHETKVPQIPMNLPRGGFVYLAQGVKKNTSLPVIACNRINDPELAECIISGGRADLVGVARGLIADPEWVNKAREGRTKQINYCIACNQGCFDHVFSLKQVGCLVNPRAGREAETRIEPAAQPKKIMVAGGGPAGLSFALTAARRSHSVSLYEKADNLGGQIHLAAALPERSEFLTMIRSLEARALAAGVKIVTGRAVDADLAQSEKPDLLAVACGGRPLEAPFPGADRANVVQAWDVLAGRAETGPNVVVIGGGAVGCETALFLARIGSLTADELNFLFLNRAETPEELFRLATTGVKKVTMLEMTGRVGSDIGMTTGWIIRQDLKQRGVRVLTKTKALEITDEGVSVVKEEKETLIPAETVVLALGTQPEDGLTASLAGSGLETLTMGDADRPAKAFDAVRQGFDLAMKV